MSEKRWVGADMLQENLLLSLTLENADVGRFVCEDDENTQMVDLQGLLCHATTT